MRRETENEITCPTCNGRKVVEISWVDADLRQRVRRKMCSFCKGTGKLVVRLPYKDS